MIDSTVSASYLVGVTVAIIAGIAFNLGMVIQKLAVMKVSHETSLMRQLVRSLLWLTGFALQFIVGMPLNMLTQSKIGPTGIAPASPAPVMRIISFVITRPLMGVI